MYKFLLFSFFIAIQLIASFSKDASAQWRQLDLKTNNSVHYIAPIFYRLFVGYSDCLYYSTNNGVNWESTNLNSPVYHWKSGNNTIAATPVGIYISFNVGISWQYKALSNNIIYRIYETADKMFACTNNGLYSSTDLGITWFSNGMTNKTIKCFTESYSNFLLGTANEGVYISTNQGVNWSQTSLNNVTVNSLLMTVNGNYAGTTTGLYFKNNDSTNWRPVGSNNINVTSLYYPYPDIMAGTTTGVFYSSNNGITWTQSLNDKSVNSVIKFDSTLYAGTNSYEYYTSTNNGANWIQKVRFTDFSSVISDGNNIFAGANDGMYKSTNSGTNWTKLNFDSYQTVRCLEYQQGTLFAGVSNFGVRYSPDNGNVWLATSLNNQTVYALASSDTNLFAGTLAGVHRTTNGGFNWTLTSLNFKPVLSLSASGNKLYAGTDTLGVFFSTNNGANWIQGSLNNRRILSLGSSGDYVFAGVNSTGVYLSSNGGLNWSISGLVNKTVKSIVVRGSTVFAGANDGLYISSNNGLTWIRKNDGYPSMPAVNAISINNNYIYAFTNNISIWRRPVNEIGIQKISDEIPESYSLIQNYPNPFNSQTVIKYAIKKSDNVKIIITDLLGREIKTLVNQYQKPGYYSIDFNAENLPSGIYFYTLKTASYTESKRLVLLK